MPLYDELFYECIKRRKDYPAPLLSIKKLLIRYDMGLYAEIVCERISKEKLIDNKHVFLDFENVGDLEVDLEGLSRCRKLLLNYIGTDDFADVHEYFDSYVYTINLRNSLLKQLRGYTKKELKKFVTECNNHTPDGSPEIPELMNVELKSRSVINKIRSICISLYLNCYYRIKYLRIHLILCKWRLRK